MRASIVLFAVLSVLTTRSVASFAPTGSSVVAKESIPNRRNTFLRVSKDDDLIPETSFGAEAVPDDFIPVNEYLNLLRQPMFGWASEETGSKGFLIRLVAVYGVVFGAICYPISGATFTQEGYLLQKIAASNVGALLLLFVLMVRLYSGWGYVAQRLQSKNIEYEETGWYDGDVEEKTEEEKQRDKFLYQSSVKPVEDRLKAFSLAIGGLFVASCICFNVAMSAKPVFDEYDPAMLEQLRFDDNLAGKAAEQSFGKPTYCDNRYYRAVAGGSGCK
jgi:hypothetical protein